MLDYILDLNKVDRQAIRDYLAYIEGKAAGSDWSTADIEQMSSLVKRLAHMLIDDAGLSAADKEYSVTLDPTDVSHQYNLSSVSADEVNPNWSWDGKNVTFASKRHGGTNYEIYIMDMFGLYATRITNSEYNSASPAWSPNGYKIAFTRDTPPAETNPMIYIMNTDGTDLLETGVRGSRPVWSPDGIYISFQRANTSGSSDIFTMYADATEVREISYGNQSGYYDPAWSPDSRKIAYTGFEGSFQIFSMDYTGENLKKLTIPTNPGDTNRQPNWSPNGERIAYASWRDGTAQIYTMKADGTDKIRLSHNQGHDQRPKYSPDGTLILCSSTRDGFSQIYSMNADGTPVAPEYRHEYMMAQDKDYFNAWAYEFSSIYRPIVNASPNLLASVHRGRMKFTYRESDPNIVDRSLYRHALRTARPEDKELPEIVGANIPKIFVNGGMEPRLKVVGEGGQIV